MIRKTYIRKVEARLARLEEDIERLRNRMAVPVGEIRDRFEREIPVLHSKAEAVRKRIRAVEAAGATNWGLLKNAVDDGLRDLGQALDVAIDKFRKAVPDPGIVERARMADREGPPSSPPRDDGLPGASGNAASSGILFQDVLR